MHSMMNGDHNKKSEFTNMMYYENNMSSGGGGGGMQPQIYAVNAVPMYAEQCSNSNSTSMPPLQYGIPGGGYINSDQGYSQQHQHYQPQPPQQQRQHQTDTNNSPAPYPGQFMQQARYLYYNAHTQSYQPMYLVPQLMQLPAVASADPPSGYYQGGPHALMDGYNGYYNAGTGSSGGGLYSNSTVATMATAVSYLPQDMRECATGQLLLSPGVMDNDEELQHQVCANGNAVESQSLPSLHGDSSLDSVAALSSTYEDDEDEEDEEDYEDQTLNTVHGEDMVRDLESLSIFQNIRNYTMTSSVPNVHQQHHQQQSHSHHQMNAAISTLTLITHCTTGASVTCTSTMPYSLTSAPTRPPVVAAVSLQQEQQLQFPISSSCSTISVPVSVATAAQHGSSRFKKTRIKERMMMWHSGRLCVKDTLVTLIPELVMSIRHFDLDTLDRLEVVAFGDSLLRLKELAAAAAQQEQCSSPHSPEFRSGGGVNCDHTSQSQAAMVVPPPPRSPPPPPPPNISLPSGVVMPSRSRQHYRPHSCKTTTTSSSSNVTPLLTPTSSTLASGYHQRQHRKSLQIPFPLIVNQPFFPFSSQPLPGASRLAAANSHYSQQQPQQQYHYSNTNNVHFCTPVNGIDKKRRRRWSVSDSKLDETVAFTKQSGGGGGSDTHNSTFPTTHRNSFQLDLHDLAVSSNFCGHDNKLNLLSSLESKIDHHLMQLKGSVMGHMESQLGDLSKELQQLRHINYDLETKVRNCQTKVCSLEESIRLNLPETDWPMFGLTAASLSMAPSTSTALE